MNMMNEKTTMHFAGTGEDSEWKHYKMRVLAHAHTKGWQKALLEERTIRSDTVVATGRASEEELKVIKENNKAWEFLTKTCMKT